MKISIIAVGRLKSGAEQTLFNRYFDLFNAAARNLKIATLAHVEIGEGKGENLHERKDHEAHQLLAKLPERARLIALDSQGQLLTSEELTALVSRLRDEALDAVFAVGGPDGHGEVLLSSAHFRLSLGRLTLPHGLARIVLMEQLYRALSMMQGHPYHRALTDR